jgi:hypothetical protein
MRTALGSTQINRRTVAAAPAAMSVTCIKYDRYMAALRLLDEVRCLDVGNPFLHRLPEDMRLAQPYYDNLEA